MHEPSLKNDLTLAAERLPWIFQPEMTSQSNNSDICRIIISVSINSPSRNSHYKYKKNVFLIAFVPESCSTWYSLQ